MSCLVISSSIDWDKGKRVERTLSGWRDYMLFAISTLSSYQQLKGHISTDAGMVWCPHQATVMCGNNLLRATWGSQEGSQVECSFPACPSCFPVYLPSIRALSVFWKCIQTSHQAFLRMASESSCFKYFPSCVQSFNISFTVVTFLELGSREIPMNSC